MFYCRGHSIVETLEEHQGFEPYTLENVRCSSFCLTAETTKSSNKLRTIKVLSQTCSLLGKDPPPPFCNPFGVQSSRSIHSFGCVSPLGRPPLPPSATHLEFNHEGDFMNLFARVPWGDFTPSPLRPELQSMNKKSLTRVHTVGTRLRRVTTVAWSAQRDCSATSQG